MGPHHLFRPLLGAPRLRRVAAVAATLAASLLVAGPARADLPPPDGTKFVGYAYAVEGLEGFADYVLLAYPSSVSNGRPMDDYAEVTSAPTSLGRRGGSPKLYAAKRADYEAWKASLAPRGPDAPLSDDPVLVAFFTSDEVARCDEAPSPTFTLPSTDPRERVVERFRAVALGAGRCDLERLEGDAPSKGPEAGGFATPPDGAEAPSSPAASSGAPAASSGGCAGCAIASVEEEGGLAALVGALGLGLGLAARRGGRGGAS